MHVGSYYQKKLIVRSSAFCASKWLTLHVDELYIFCFLSADLVTPKQEADGSTVGCCCGDLPSPIELWVGYDLLSAPFLQSSQQRCARAPTWLLISIQKRLHISEAPGLSQHVPKKRGEGITESLRLKKSTDIIQSHCQPISTMPTNQEGGTWK